VGKDNLLTSKEELTAYSYDASPTWTHLPEAVIFPNSAAQVSEVLKLANEHGIPVTPRGGGTNVSGGSIPIKGGIVLCTTRMNRIIEINGTDLNAIVEPGVVLQDFNTALAKEGLFFPPDPQSFLGCTIGGAVAENAGGPSCLKYGVTKQYILGLEVVIADGSIMKLGGLTAKNRTGYELVMLFTGSEGTLGIITRITLRLMPLPRAKKTMVAVFNDVAVAGQAVSNIIANSIVPSKIEFIDRMLMKRFQELLPSGLPADAEVLLLIETDGLPETVAEEAKQIIDICANSGAEETLTARDQAEADSFWQARRAGFSDVNSAAHTVLSEDVVVPRSRIAEFVTRCRDMSQRYDLQINLLGHAGDGNLHPAVLTDDRDSEHYGRALKFVDEIIETALSLGGVLSGEHGVGLEKQRFLRLAMDPVAIEIMKKIKDVLDPNHILNPGKVWEETPDE